MTEIEARLHYATKQRESNANDAAGWFGIAEGLKEKIAEAEKATKNLMTKSNEASEKLLARIAELEAQVKKR